MVVATGDISEVIAPPALYNQEAEEAVLGSILINPEIYYDIAAILKADDFYVQRYKWIWDAFVSLSEHKMAVDFVTLSDKLEQKGQLEEIGGPALLSKLVSNVPTSLHAENYANIIYEFAKRRKMVKLANDLARAAYDREQNIEVVSIDVMDQLSQNDNSNEGPVPIKDLVSKLFDQVSERIQNPTKVWGIPTGFIDYDTTLGGLQFGEVLYIAGAPGIGKSILANQIGLNAAMLKYPGVIFSLEMQNMMVARRLVSSMGKIETRQLKSGVFSEDNFAKFIHACEETAALPMYICDKPDLTTNQLHSHLSRLRSVANIKWFVLDYLMLMGDPGADDNERSAAISRRIVSIAKKLNLAGITVNSVLKDVMDGGKRPTQASVRGSGSLIHDANVIMFLTDHQTAYGHPDQSIRTCLIEKVRDEDCSKSSFEIRKTSGYPGFMDIQVHIGELVDHTR